MNYSCGLTSEDECKEMFEAVLVKEYSDYRYVRVHRLTIDAYSLQHPQIYMKSPKSFAAHLTGMSCAIEYDNDPNLLRILQKWLNGRKELSKPAMLSSLGNLTIAHIIKAKDGGEHIGLVKEWAIEVWKAYQVYHDLAHDWIKIARQQYYG